MAKQQKTATGRVLHDPIRDKLTPIQPLDLGKIKTIDDLVRAMGRTSFTARQVGDAADVLEAMARDKNCYVVLTLSGAMTVAKMSLVITDLIDAGIVKAIVSTGALMAHGLVEAAGRSHFRYDSGMDDEQLFLAGYNRVYDSIEPEVNLDYVENIADRIFDNWDSDKTVSSWLLLEKIGDFLVKHAPGRGILKSARQRNVPVYIPAFTDSELGIDLDLHNRWREREGMTPLRFDPYSDFRHFGTHLMQQKEMGILTIGGGVPRNWTQQFGVFAELLIRHGYEKGDLKRYKYGVRICPEPVHWGGLSGSTYSEGISWGKFVPPEQGGRFAEVFEDATVAMPLVVGAVLERIGYKRKKARHRRR